MTEVTTPCTLTDWRLDRDGYGRRNLGPRDSRVSWLAHRWAWTQAHGPIPKGMCVLHRCDNPPCVNVEHLFLGTNADNMADKVAKGRQVRGEQHGRARLHESDVHAIRSRSGKGDAVESIAMDYGVTVQMVRLIVRRERWAHV